MVAANYATLGGQPQPGWGVLRGGRAQAAITIPMSRCAQRPVPESTLLLKQLHNETCSGHQYRNLLELSLKWTYLVTNPSSWQFVFQ